MYFPEIKIEWKDKRGEKLIKSEEAER